MPFSSSLRFVVLVRDPIARMYSKFLHKDIAELCYCTSNYYLLSMQCCTIIHLLRTMLAGKLAPHEVHLLRVTPQGRQGALMRLSARRYDFN